MAIAQELGQSARRNPQPAVRFIRWALDHSDKEMVVRILADLLRASRRNDVHFKRQPNMWSLMTYLRQEEREDLLDGIRRLALDRIFQLRAGGVGSPRPGRNRQVACATTGRRNEP